ncbi:Hypothetical protein R9X50_00189000 [Acrodontium crateriforme]|uniref:Uncharacterized protein n=1 Tax=Acrodontium crateriforme TaxID=150365 RepID=A0AAQ3RAG0_9PEZI|nr:Hypothetical protein R9X50_00189000 [Acrodontium crateriforme]
MLKSLASFARQPRSRDDVHRGYKTSSLSFVPRNVSTAVNSSEAMFCVANTGKNTLTLILLPHLPPNMSNEETFQLGDELLWDELGNMFCNPFFARTWIQQENAKAAAINLHRGSFVICWPIFTAAFQGLIMLTRSRASFATELPDRYPLGTLIDARERWRSPEFSTCLAGALIALSYSKEKYKRDHIAAACAMTKVPIVGQTRLLLETTDDELMIHTARICITDRKDLYHLGQWSVTSRKGSSSLPTWAPDFTTGICEAAVEFASLEFSRLINGAYEIDHRNLYLNCHILDKIVRVYKIGDCGDSERIFPAVKDLEDFFRTTRIGSLFSSYIASNEDWNHRNQSRRATQEASKQLSEAKAIVNSIPDYPLAWYQGLTWENDEPGTVVDSDKILNIEALWSLLNPQSPARVPDSAPKG